MSSPRDMLTEDEAKKKWCPFAKSNRYESDESQIDCLASGCALWRWSHQDIDGVPTGFCGAGTLPKYI